MSISCKQETNEDHRFFGFVVDKDRGETKEIFRNLVRSEVFNDALQFHFTTGRDRQILQRLQEFRFGSARIETCRDNFIFIFNFLFFKGKFILLQQKE